MNTRLSTAEIQTYEKALTFNRFDVHIHGQELKRTVKELTAKLSTVESNPELKNLYRQLSIYFAFYERNKEEAHKYLEALELHCSDDNVEKAEILALKGYVNTIDPSYENPNQFQIALTIIAEEKDRPEILILKAICYQYLALMFHRQKKMGDALFYINEAISIQKPLISDLPHLKIGLAECFHLKGVMLLRQNNLDAAEKQFEKAAQLEEEFCNATEAMHFLYATTLQSYAMVCAKKGYYQIALEKLQKAYQVQQVLFKTDVHADVAKTLHFLGEVYAMNQDYNSAIAYYLVALVVKKQIHYQDNFMVNMTQKALQEALNSLSQDNYEEMLKQYKKIYKALSGETKNKFVNQDVEFTELMKTKMMAFQDKYSVTVHKTSTSPLLSPVMNSPTHQKKSTHSPEETRSPLL